MTRIALFLAALALAALDGRIAVADGGGREFVSPFKFEYSDETETETETEDEASDYSWLAKGSLGEFGYLGVCLSDRLYFRLALADAHVRDGGGSAGASSGSTSDEVAFGSAFLFKGNIFFTPGFDGSKTGLKFDSSRPIEIVEQIEDHDDWSLDLSVGYRFLDLTPEVRATFREAEDEGERLGSVFYYDNRFRVEAGLSFAATGDQPEVEAKAGPEPVIGTGFRGLFQRGFTGEFGHVAVRLSKYQDFRLDFSTAYVVRDDGGGAVGSNNPLKAIAGLFSGKKDEPEAQRFGGAYIHLNNLYVIPDSLSGFGFSLDPERDIEVVEEYDDYDDWGVRLRVGYQFNELTDVQMDAYREATERGRHFADVYYDDNRFTLRGVAGFRF